MRWKKKIITIKTSTTKKARQAYGPEAIDITDDVSVRFGSASTIIY